MKSQFVLGDSMDAIIEKANKLNGLVRIGSHWTWEQWSPASRRSRSYICADSWEEDNLCTDEGITHVLDVIFSGGSPKAAWYIALFNDDHTPAAGDTYQSPGYTETVNYDEGSRVTWQEGGVVSKNITNDANRASLTMNAVETIYGGALVSASTKGDIVSGEVLFCSSKFTTEKEVEDDDVLKVIVSITGSGA